MSTKVKMPAHIAKDMQWYRKQAKYSWSAVPTSYVLWHKELAEAALVALKEQGFQEVHDTRRMDSDGWFDGMRTLHVTVIKGDKVYRIHWHDGNQEFFVSYPDNCGSGPLRFEEDAGLATA